MLGLHSHNLSTYLACCARLPCVRIKERAYHLERQLEARERRQKERERAHAKEVLANRQFMEKTSSLAWYNKQRERATRPLAATERKAVQQRLYAVTSAKREARVYG